jgi:hypothetical protein
MSCADSSHTWRCHPCRASGRCRQVAPDQPALDSPQPRTAEAAIKAVDQAVQTLGGHGMTEERGVGIVHPMVRVAHLAPISSEMLLNFIAEHTLGLEKSY